MPTVRQRYRQTDRRTDGRLTIAIPRFALRASRGNYVHVHTFTRALLTANIEVVYCYYLFALVVFEYLELHILQQVSRPEQRCLNATRFVTIHTLRNAERRNHNTIRKQKLTRY